MAKRVSIHGHWFRKRRGKWVIIPLQWAGHTVYRSKCHAWHFCPPKRFVREEVNKRLLQKEAAAEALDCFQDKYYPVCVEVNNEVQE
ncbi:MAG: hypothetical protein E6R04_11150 [Spirochaetes bacterium]|nr:MAG: hypothetical protein E6R04_11150 [Spirochaetota bacterium]